MLVNNQFIYFYLLYYFYYCYCYYIGSFFEFNKYFINYPIVLYHYLYLDIDIDIDFDNIYY